MIGLVPLRCLPQNMILFLAEFNIAFISLMCNEQEVHPSLYGVIITLCRHTLGQQCAGYLGNGRPVVDVAALTRPDRLMVGDEAMFSLLFELLANFA